MSRPTKSVVQVIQEMPKRAFRWTLAFSFIPWFCLDAHSGLAYWLGVILSDAIIVACGLIAIKGRGASLIYELKRVRFDYPLRYWAVGFLASLCIANFSFNAMYRSHHFLVLYPLDGGGFSHTFGDLIFNIGTFTIVPIAEELMFRGMLARNEYFWKGKYGSIIFASLWFASGHYHTNYLPTFMNAIVWCLILRRTRNIAISMTHHAAWNFLCSVPFFVSYAYPGYEGWHGFVPAPVFEVVRWGSLAVAIGCYYFLFFRVGLMRPYRRGGARRWWSRVIRIVKWRPRKAKHAKPLLRRTRASA